MSPHKPTQITMLSSHKAKSLKWWRTIFTIVA